MRERIQFLFIYFGFWVIYFLCARVIFLTYHIDQTKLVTLETLAGIFWNGIRMDMSMAAYLSLLPFLWVSFSNFIKKSVFETTLFSYTLIAVFFVTLLVVIDLEVYNVWNYRLDATPLRYLDTPKEAWASVKSSPVLRLFISYIILLIIASYFVYRIIANKINSWNFTKKWRFIPWALLLTAALSIPLRGGITKTSLKPGTVYFSENNFANISTLNSCWNFFYSLFNKAYDKVNPYSFLPNEVILRSMKELFQKNGEAIPVIRKTQRPPNVLLIICKNFSEKVIDQSHGGIEITPNFNLLKKEGIYFPNTYAAGDATEKGLVAILSGFPAQPKESILQEPNKSRNLPFLTKDIQNKGYRTEFYYGGDSEFPDLRSYLLEADFEQIIDVNDFGAEFSSVSTASDNERVFDKFLEDHLRERKDPFFSALLTNIIANQPLENESVPGDNPESMFFNAIKHTDHHLGGFIGNAKRQSWWKNTVVIILGDQGSALPKTGNRSEDFKIPMLWTGGAVTDSQIIKNTVSQTSVARSLLESLGINASKYNWGRNIFRINEKQWAYFCFNDGFGYVTPNKVLLFDNVGKRLIYSEGEIGEKELRLGKALQQKSFQEYLDK